jgi:broad specificity phosphatase PhoE
MVPWYTHTSRVFTLGAMRHVGALSRRSLLSGLGVVFFSSTSSARSASELSLPPLREGERRLYLVRHGETDWNVEDRIQGLTDNPLNANGRAQAEAVSRYLANEPLDLITSSSLQRASDTADAIAKRHPGTRREPGLPAFVEMSFGEYEGRRLGEIEREYKSYIGAWRAGDNAKAWPHGESPDAVAARGLAGLRSLGVLPSVPAGGDGDGGTATASQRVDAEDAQRVLIVAHGRFNKILIAALGGDVSAASDVQQGNTCLNVLDVAPDGAVDVRLLNGRGHLEVPALSK